LERIENAGGTLAAIESGLIQREIQESAYRAQVEIESGTAVVVGVNKFGDRSLQQRAPLFHVDPDIERRQIERVRAVRASRSREDWQAALLAVSSAARDGGNLVPPIVSAVTAKATVGEIADALRAVFGEYRDVSA
jgi:methylmalonyl-CoA mutase N-terminal domain/subunit